MHYIYFINVSLIIGQEFWTSSSINQVTTYSRSTSQLRSSSTLGLICERWQPKHMYSPTSTHSHILLQHLRSLIGRKQLSNASVILTHQQFSPPHFGQCVMAVYSNPIPWLARRTCIFAHQGWSIIFFWVVFFCYYFHNVRRQQVGNNAFRHVLVSEFNEVLVECICKSCRLTENTNKSGWNSTAQNCT